MATQQNDGKEPSFILDNPGSFAALFALGVVAVFCGLLYTVVVEAKEHEKEHAAEHAGAHGSAAPHASGAASHGSAGESHEKP